MKTTSMGGVGYFSPKKVLLYVMISKSDCFEKLNGFKAFIETQLEHEIKTFWLDNGGKFVSKAFNHFLRDHGINKKISTPYMPQENEMGNNSTPQKRFRLLPISSSPTMINEPLLFGLPRPFQYSHFFLCFSWPLWGGLEKNELIT